MVYWEDIHLLLRFFFLKIIFDGCVLNQLFMICWSVNDPSQNYTLFNQMLCLFWYWSFLTFCLYWNVDLLLIFWLVCYIDFFHIVCWFLLFLSTEFDITWNFLFAMYVFVFSSSFITLLYLLLTCQVIFCFLMQAYIEKEDSKKLKQKQRERMQPKMGKMDIDYQVLLYLYLF